MDELKIDSLDTKGLAGDLYSGMGDLYDEAPAEKTADAAKDIPLPDLPKLDELPPLPPVSAPKPAAAADTSASEIAPLPKLSPMDDLPPLGGLADMDAPKPAPAPLGGPADMDAPASGSRGGQFEEMGGIDTSSMSQTSKGGQFEEMGGIDTSSMSQTSKGGQFEEMGGIDTSSMSQTSKGGQFEEMGGIGDVSAAVADMGDKAMNDPNVAPGAPQKYKRYSGADYAPQNVSAYRTQENPDGTPGGYNGTPRQTNMDKLYEQRYAQDYEKSEKGRKKAEIISLVGMIYYGISVFLYLITLIGGITFSGVLGLLIGAAAILCFYMFRKGSNKAREILGWIASLNTFRGALGIIFAIIGGGVLASLGGSIGAGAGVFMVLRAIANVVFNGYLAWLFFADEEIAEYCKTMRDGGLGSDMDNAIGRFFFGGRF